MKSALYVATGLILIAQSRMFFLWRAFGFHRALTVDPVSMGALLLVVAGLVSLRFQGTGAWLAIVSLVLLWFFALGRIVVGLLPAFHQVRRYAAHPHAWLYPVLELVLLIACSFCAIRDGKKLAR